MELKDTVEMMTSSDYKERFLAEYHQLMIRYSKLEAMIRKLDTGTLEFTPTCPRSTYMKQLSSMNDYMTMLEARAAMEGILL